MAKLKELFPGEQFSVLQATLSTFAGDINKAAAHLAGCGEGEHHFVAYFVCTRSTTDL